MKRLTVLALLLCGFVSARAQEITPGFVYMRGDADLEFSDSRVWVDVDVIENLSTNRSELLRFRVFATENRFGENGDIHVLGKGVIRRMNGGHIKLDENHEPVYDTNGVPEIVSRRRINVHKSFHMSDPDRGLWFITLALEERVKVPGEKARWVIRDAYPFGRQRFGGL